MFLSLLHEGWRESEVLPHDWIYKKHGNNLMFLSNVGDFIQYVEAFLAWLQASGVYSSNEIEMAKQLQSENDGRASNKINVKEDQNFGNGHIKEIK